MKEKLKAGECPEKLAELLKIVNLVPSDVIFPTSEELKEIYKKRRQKRGDEFFNEKEFNESFSEDYRFTEGELYVEYLGKRDELIREIIKNYPALLEYIFDTTLSLTKNEFAYAFRYIEFAELRVWLRRIAIQNTNYAFSKGAIKHFNLYISGNPQFEHKSNATYYINEKGEMDFHFEPIIEAVKGYDAIRLRICPVCKNIFWAKKTNSITCAEKKCIDDFQNLKKKAEQESKQKT